MKKVLKQIGICLLLAVFVWAGSGIFDRVRLKEELIRLHVVAASDTQTDQMLKLRVKEAVVDSLRTEITKLGDPEEAKAYLQENLPKIETVANEVLRQAGSSDTVSVSLGIEEFSKRVYDTFSLPAGLYHSLRIIIGEGEGKNWWCVVYPSLCMPETAEEFEETARCAGFDDSMTLTLTGEYEIRFFLLELLGRLENLLHRE